MKTFYELFITELNDALSAENQFLTALLKMGTYANSVQLKDAMIKCVNMTQGHVKQLNQVFKDLKEKPSNAKSDGMEGLFKEELLVVKEDYNPLVKDAAFITCIQRMEHYQIALYGTLKTFAKHLELDKIKKTLELILADEKNADKMFSQIAEGQGINKKALERKVA